MRSAKRKWIFGVLPDPVSPVELPATSETGFELWDELVDSTGDNLVTSSGELLVIADSSLSSVKLQIAAVVLPSTVAPVEVD